ncbi:MAG: hypothetical protein KBS85_01995 [Lachnospiraceae bacterium]|nr:hypothetical protein [Candidatus Merdinaster equi]
MKKTNISLVAVLILTICLISGCGAAPDEGNYFHHQGTASGNGTGNVPSANPGSTGIGVREDITDQLSDNLLIGMDFGGGGDDYYSSLSSNIIIHKDHTVEVEFEGEKLGESKLTDASYDAIASGIDFNELYYLDPEIDEYVLDGYSVYVFLYNKEDSVLKGVGGYMAGNDYLYEVRELISKNVDMEWANDLVDEKILEMMAEREH